MAKITPDPVDPRQKIDPAGFKSPSEIKRKPPIDLTGQRFGRLTVLRKNGHDSSGKNIAWICICDCGKELTTLATNLRKNRTKSCGCLRQELIGKTSRIHGHAALGNRSPEYRTWQQMKNRCLNPNNDSYSYYGGRGILVHKSWIESFEAFFADVGTKPSSDYSLDRIDVNGNYEPTNVRWATKDEQMKNRRQHCYHCGKELHCLACSFDGTDYC